ncbi:Glu-tRNA(Gln) amidotransferase subunit GatD [Candidatus Micrarchaeota archaeon]|nr:Glu-tRNA(Gln) amidotransferase subunit GatD [Candidatus Micrarchaeota archaeon]
MYSDKVKKLLKKKNIGVGDLVRVLSRGARFTGMLMPRPFSGDPDVVVIKQESGYNIGIKADEIELLETAGARPEHKAEQEAPKKGDVAILGCGGTIASRIEYKTGAVYPSITPKELRTAFPKLKKWPIHSRQIFSLFSEDMNAGHWRVLADEIENEIKKGSEGVVVMHGTDTMAYTAAAMSFMLQNLPVPVVLVGSQRSSDRPSSENEMNLLNSVYAATKDVGEVMVCMHSSTNDDYCHFHRGTKVRKMHTSRRDAFHSINALPLFRADYRNDVFEELSGHRKRSGGELVSRKKLNDNIAMVYAHPNIRPEFISGLDSYDGVVLVGTGLGHVPVNAFDDKTVTSIYQPLKELIESGIPVVMSSQCISGRLCMRVYTNGRLLNRAGVIGDGADWTPETAYVKLCWVLGQTRDMKKAGKLMMADVAGEISSRSVLEEI